MAEKMGRPSGEHLADSIDDQCLLALSADPETEDFLAAPDEVQARVLGLEIMESSMAALDDKYASLLQSQEVLLSSAAAAAVLVTPPLQYSSSSHHHEPAAGCSYRLKGPSTSLPDTGDSSFELAFCDVCADAKPSAEMFPNPNCGHVFCKHCVRRYISTKLQENVTAVRCLASGCGGALEPVHCRDILPADVFDRWGMAICEATFLGLRTFYCPFKDCSAPMLDDGEGVRQSECPHCHRLFCARCGVPWHAGVECVEFQRLRVDERGSQDLLLLDMVKSKSWKRCPACRFYVEKVAGCLHMTCRCGIQFCYGCGSNWNDSHLKCHT